MAGAKVHSIFGSTARISPGTCGSVPLATLLYRGSRDARRVSLRSLLSAVAPPLCAGCGARAGRAEPLCSDCRCSLRWIGATLWADGVPVWVALTYEGGARALVSALK